MDLLGRTVRKNTSSRAIGVVAIVACVSLLLTACEPDSMLRLLGNERVADTAAAQATDPSGTTGEHSNSGAHAATDAGAGTASDGDADSHAHTTTADDAVRSSGPRVEAPPSSEERTGNFLVKCRFSHREQVDPIVNPGPPGTQSMHLHDFFGNTSTASDSTYASMTAAGTTCVVGGDTAAYWAPTLLDPHGDPVKPEQLYSYYRNRPAAYSATVAFPPDFRLIAGGVDEYPENVWWNCHDDDSETVRYDAPPRCTTSNLTAAIMFPNCWDGVNLDAADHRSHVVYPTGSRCPASHPVKLPDVRYAIHYPKGSGGPGWTLADGTTVPHADFWNTWDQTEFERWLDDCTRVRTCGRVHD